MSILTIKNLEKLITVNIYAKLLVKNPSSEQTSIMCDDVMTVSGIEFISDYYVKFYSDINGTIPINLNGMDIVINYETITTDNLNNTVTTNIFSENAIGLETTLVEVFTNSVIQTDCENNEIVNITGSVSLLPGDYVII